MTEAKPSVIITGAAAMWASDHAVNIAERALTKLTEAGYVIVKLPERLPGYVDGEKPRWEILGTVIQADRCGVHKNGLLLYPDEARAMAVRLLAAANAAEQLVTAEL